MKLIKRSVVMAVLASVAVMALLVGQSLAQFPAGPADDNTTSLGKFKIWVAPKFRPIVTGCPGYNGATFIWTSPLLYDPATVIGRSAVHVEGSMGPPGDIMGTVAGTSNPQSIFDALMTVRPPGYETGPGVEREVHTHVSALNMADFGGTGVLLRAGPGAIPPVVRFPSPGEVESLDPVGNPANDFPAQSFFDVYVEVDLPACGASWTGGTIYNPFALLVQDTITSFPPRVVYIHGNSTAVPVLTMTPNPPAWLANELFGFLVLAGHGISYDTSASDTAEFEEIMAAADTMPKPPYISDQIGPKQGLTFAWYQNGEMVEDVEWYYTYGVSGEAPTTRFDTHTGKLDFREKFPEHENRYVQFTFFPPEGQNGWRQAIIYLPTGSASDVFATGSCAGNWTIPDIAPSPGCEPDTIYTAVDFSVFCISDTVEIIPRSSSIGHNLSEYDVKIANGQIEGFEGIYWATTEFELNPSTRGLRPVGGVNTLLNSDDYSGECPEGLMIVAEHTGGTLEGGSACCTGARGNINGDADEKVNVADVTYLVSYLFGSGSPPPCWEEADITGDGSVNLSDMTVLVDFLFGGGAAPLSCP